MTQVPHSLFYYPFSSSTVGSIALSHADFPAFLEINYFSCFGGSGYLDIHAINELNSDFVFCIMRTTNIDQATLTNDILELFSARTKRVLVVEHMQVMVSVN